MSEEGVSHTLTLQTFTSVSNKHTGGPMQLQASADTEEKRVSTLMLRGSRCFFSIFYPTMS